MPEILVSAFITVTVAMLAGFFVVERRNAKRTRCRCCGGRIPPGGVGCAQLGSGFCSRCLSGILRESRR